MLKRISLIALALCLVAFVCSCTLIGRSNEKQGDANQNDGQTVGKGVSETIDNGDDADKEEDDSYKITISTSVSELKENLKSLGDTIESETEKATEQLYSEYEKLVGDIGTYSKYVANASKVETFYDKTVSTSEKIVESLYKYSIIYVETVLGAQISADDMYDEIDGLRDCIYDDAADILYDGIYSGVLEDIYDDFYSGILEDRDENVTYSEWSNVRSDEYKMWSDSRSDCYKQWSDMRSDIYELWSDLRSDLYKDKIEDAKDELSKFKKSFERDISQAQSTPIASTDVQTENNNISEIKEYDATDLDGMIDFIETTGEKYCAEIEEKANALIEVMGDTYKGYKDNTNKISEFYELTLKSSDEFMDKLFSVTGDYYRCVAKTQLSNYSVWADLMEDIYDAWNDVLDDYYDTWDGYFEEIYDICNELIELEYHSGVWSKMYDEYSDSWSDMYNKYSDCWDELYEIYSDVYDEFYDGVADIEGILN